MNCLALFSSTKHRNLEQNCERQTYVSSNQKYKPTAYPLHYLPSFNYSRNTIEMFEFISFVSFYDVVFHKIEDFYINEDM